VAHINRETSNRWSCVSKEILFESAKDLGIPPSDLKYFFKYHEQGVLDGMLNTLTKFYVSDRKIFKSIEKAIVSFAQHGNVVIVGRGGAAILEDHQNALHIRLMAPLSWRHNKVMEYYGMSKNEALKFIQDYDQKRTRFMAHFARRSNSDHALFDVIYNCATLSKSEVMRAIYNLMKEKQMVP
jgi:cytidylate kinase